MSVPFRLSKQQAKFFRIQYSSDYKTFIPNHVTADRMHPLNETQRRLQEARKKEGLWWHVTSGVELSKSSCVRSWARRRLRTAVLEELTARGFNQNGKSNSPGTSNTETLRTPPAMHNPMDLTGSLRLHILAALLPAKFVDIKTEVGSIIDALVEGKNHKNTSTTQVKRLLQQIRKLPAADPAPNTTRVRFTRSKPS